MRHYSFLARGMDSQLVRFSCQRRTHRMCSQQWEIAGILGIRAICLIWLEKWKHHSVSLEGLLLSLRFLPIMQRQIGYISIALLLAAGVNRSSLDIHVHCFFDSCNFQSGCSCSQCCYKIPFNPKYCCFPAVSNCGWICDSSAVLCHQ